MNDYKYSQTSIKQLNTCHDDLITICSLILPISPIDITIVCGHRTEEAQNQAFANGSSLAQWLQSAHNEIPSDAVDLAPYFDRGIQWKDVKGLYLIAGLVIGISQSLNIKIRWGGAWHGPLNPPHQFNDLYHFERIM